MLAADDDSDDAVDFATAFLPVVPPAVLAVVPVPALPVPEELVPAAAAESLELVLAPVAPGPPRPPCRQHRRTSGLYGPSNGRNLQQTAGMVDLLATARDKANYKRKYDDMLVKYEEAKQEPDKDNIENILQVSSHHKTT